MTIEVHAVDPALAALLNRVDRDLRVRCANALRAADVRTLGDLQRLGKRGFKNIKNAGNKTARAMERAGAWVDVPHTKPTADVRPWIWHVRIYWRDARGDFESGADGGFLRGTTAMQAIAEVAELLGVDLSKATSVEAKRLDDERHLP